MVSIESQFAEACDRLRAEGKFKLFNEKRAALKTSAVEPQLNLAKAVLNGEVKESIPIKKFNGASYNGREVFTESAPADMTEVAAKNKAAIHGYTVMGISESDARKTLGLPPAEIEAKGRHAVAEWLLANPR